MDESTVISATLGTCEDIFRSMLSFSFNQNLLQTEEGLNPDARSISTDVIASMPLFGKHAGTLVFYMPFDVALFFTNDLLGGEVVIQANLFEPLGEFINLMAGGIKNRLSTVEADCYELGLPQVTDEEEQARDYPVEQADILIPIETDMGNFFVAFFWT